MVMMMMMNVRNDEWLENENSSWFGCQVPTRTLIDPAGPLLSHCSLQNKRTLLNNIINPHPQTLQKIMHIFL